MKKLDDIPKKNVFKVPDGYFEELPSVIQARMTAAPKRSAMEGLTMALKYVLSVAALVVAAIIWFRPESSIETQLNSIDPNQIALYLDNTYTADIFQDEESVWTTEQLDSLEVDVYSNMEYSVTEAIPEDIDL
jgi:hypothetical protein